MGDVATVGANDMAFRSSLKSRLLAVRISICYIGLISRHYLFDLYDRKARCVPVWARLVKPGGNVGTTFACPPIEGSM